MLFYAWNTQHNILEVTTGAAARGEDELAKDEGCWSEHEAYSETDADRDDIYT